MLASKSLLVILIVAASIFGASAPRRAYAENNDCFKIETNWKMSFEDIKAVVGEPTSQARVPEEAPELEILNYDNLFFNGIPYTKSYFIENGEFYTIYYSFDISGFKNENVDTLFADLEKKISCNFKNEVKGFSFMAKEVRLTYRLWEDDESLADLSKSTLKPNVIELGLMKKTEKNKLSIETLKKLYNRYASQEKK